MEWTAIAQHHKAVKRSVRLRSDTQTDACIVATETR